MPESLSQKEIRACAARFAEASALYREDSPANVQAAALVEQMHERLKGAGYTGHPLAAFLVRLLFCLFADDLGIFEHKAFCGYIRSNTAEDGHDMAARLAELFEVLNAPEEQRLCTCREPLRSFPYVGGALFAEPLPMPAFDAHLRGLLLQCCAQDWGEISPAILGSAFQSALQPETRRSLGAHYTSERHILKLITPLFMNDLRDELEGFITTESPHRRACLQAFHAKLSRLVFLDPACGCGNFLVVAYRELRLLEMRVIKALDEEEPALPEILSLLHVGQFYGIELEAFPAHIAQVSLWLMELGMNAQLGRRLGKPLARAPLHQAACITCGNALRLDWGRLVPQDSPCYILGNPPFSGARTMNKLQKDDVRLTFAGIPNAGDLDYVACWFKKAAELVKGRGVQAAFVATNSIVQGQAAAFLWELLLQELRISFAYRSFKWSSVGENDAAVHCVIVGLAHAGARVKNLIVDEDGNSIRASHINAYLLDAPDTYIANRGKPLCPVPAIGIGNKPVDGGFYLFSHAEMESFIAMEPQAAEHFRPWVGARELLHGEKRYCLWLGKCSSAELAALPECCKRAQMVQQFRLASPSAPTRKLAACPTRFHVENMPMCRYLAIPKVSSVRRLYIPMQFMEPEALCSDLLHIIPRASLYHFGILSSRMHMAWVRAIAGRLKSDLRYSAKLVYNNFPWPAPSAELRAGISRRARAVLLARALYSGRSLAALYDPLSMPPELLDAHCALDLAVEKAYGRHFASDAERVAFLFAQYRLLCAADCS